MSGRAGDTEAEKGMGKGVGNGRNVQDEEW